MAALDRPSDALDGTPSALRRPRRGILGAAFGTDPRTEGAPARTRPKLRFERQTDDPVSLPPQTTAGSAVREPAELMPEPSAKADTDSADTVAVPEVAEPEVAEREVVEPRHEDAPELVPFDHETVATPISGVPTIEVRGPVPDVAPDEPGIDPHPTPPGPLVITPARIDPALPPLAKPEKVRRVGTRRAPKPRVRRVRRVLRSIDTWTVFKLSVLFYLVLYAILMVAGVLLWNLAYATGTIDNLERFFESFGWETFEFQGGALYHSAWIAGLFLVAAATGLNVVMATVFNLMADLVGGVGVTVLEEEVRIVPDSDVGQRRPRRRRR